MKFYISSQCSAERRIGAAIRELAALGFHNIELTGGTEWHPGLVEEVCSLGADRGLDLMIHNYFPPQEKEFVVNLALVDPARKAHTRQFLREAVALTRRLGKSVYGVHPGFRQDVGVELQQGFFRAGDPAGTSETAFYEMLEDVSVLASTQNLHIAIENLAPRSREDPFSLLTTPDDIHRFLEFAANKTHLGLLLDFGHLGAASHHFDFDVQRELDRIFEHPEKLFEIHLSENQGGRDAHGVTPLDSWQLHHLKPQLHRLGDIPIVFEWQRAATPDSARRFAEIVQSLQTARPEVL